MLLHHAAIPATCTWVALTPAMWKRRPRLQGFSYIGQFQYFLTFCSSQRRAIFRDPALARALVSQILREAAENAFAVPAYICMPDHMHLYVVGLQDDSDLQAFVKRAKQKTGYWYKQKTKAELWQSGYYDTVIRRDVHAWAVIRYIVENPIRAGLVSAPDEYEFWGSDQYTREAILVGLQDAPSGWSPP